MMFMIQGEIISQLLIEHGRLTKAQLLRQAAHVASGINTISMDLI